jgi:hypothetical protein
MVFNAVTKTWYAMTSYNAVTETWYARTSYNALLVHILGADLYFYSINYDFYSKYVIKTCNQRAGSKSIKNTI